MKYMKYAWGEKEREETGLRGINYLRIFNEVGEGRYNADARDLTKWGGKIGKLPLVRPETGLTIGEYSMRVCLYRTCECWNE